MRPWLSDGAMATNYVFTNHCKTLFTQPRTHVRLHARVLNIRMVSLNLAQARELILFRPLLAATTELEARI